MAALTYSLVIQSANAGTQTASSALHFASALLDAGHSLYRIFFLDDGVYAGNAHAVPSQDNPDWYQAWSELSQTSGAELVLCVSSALRRGLLDSREAQRYEKSGAAVTPPFEISGLGQLVDACLVSDRIVSFG